jgi:Uma2 family endonuclease
MEDLISRPPRTIMEVYKMLPEGTLAELIDGNIYMSPAPNSKHQEITTELASYIFIHVKEHVLGKTYASPIDVFLDEQKNAVQPDIVFIAEKNQSIIKVDAIHGSPDMVIEVLSPGNKNQDLVKKKNLYEKFGVKELWIIDPETKEATGYFLEGGLYREFFKSVGHLQSQLLNTTFKF